MAHRMTRTAGLVGVSLLASALTGCSSIFDPSTDDVIDPGNLTSAAAIQTLLNGARRDFALAYVGTGDGTQEGIILTAGLAADEFDNSDTFPTRQEIDQRRMQANNPSLLGVYAGIHRARAAADQASALARSAVPDEVDAIAELQEISGLSLLSFADNYCSGTPTSALSGETLVYGDPQTTAELYAAAIAKFDSALALGPSSDLVNASAVGKGRALLGLGQFAAAGTAVAGVPTGYLQSTFHSEVTGVVSNGIWSFVNDVNRWTVAAGTGGGIDFVGAQDPRVPTEDTGGPGFDGATPQINQLLFPTRVSSVPIVTGIEARLIQAEAAYKAGSSAGMLTILNDLRTGVPGLDPLADPGTNVGREDLLFRERAFWLYSTARRLGDLRRLIRQYGRNAESVFPTGDYYKSGEYGTDVNIPISFEERNNPNVGASGPECLDRNP